MKVLVLGFQRQSWMPLLARGGRVKSVSEAIQKYAENIEKSLKYQARVLFLKVVSNGLGLSVDN